MSDVARLIDLRRQFHAHAELAFTEVWTACLIRRELAAIAADTANLAIHTGRSVLAPPTDQTAHLRPSEAEMAAAVERAIAGGADPDLAHTVGREGTAVVADIRGNRPGPFIGYRADFDALPIDESAAADHFPARENFTSIWPTMHACGHDGHAAIALVLARRLAQDNNFPGTVRIIFQPGEEMVRGAAPMIAAGVADPVEVMLGLHLGEEMPAGDLCAGSFGLQATEKYEVAFTGVAAHAAAAPQAGRNAIAAAAQATLGLLALSRDARGTTNVNVGKISGGRQSNIVPDHAWLAGEVRSDNDEVCAEMMHRVEQVIAGAGLAWDVTSQLTRLGRSGTLHCDASVVDHAFRCAQEISGRGAVHREVQMSASDDLSLWVKAVQERGGVASYLVVGGSNPAPHHNPKFDIAESALLPACDWVEKIIRTWPGTEDVHG